MGKHCTCGDFISEDLHCKEHGSLHGHWPVLTWTGYASRGPTQEDGPEASR